MDEAVGYRTLNSTPKRIFAIGDVHGCVEELNVLLSYLEQELGLDEHDAVVFIGDYIDRGPDSRGVVDRVIQVQKKIPDTITLKGNHEEMILSFLGFPGTGGGVFYKNGGRETLLSYGITAFNPGDSEEILNALPSSHVAFYTNLDRMVVLEDYIFVHAGLSPMKSLESQIDDEIFWIRDEFIKNIHRFGKTVVFGHTPFKEILFHEPYKIGIDTGLVYKNMLSCIELRSRTTYQVQSGGAAVVVRERPKTQV